MNLLIPNLSQQLSFSKSLSTTTTPQLQFLPTTIPLRPRFPTIIRMGGGPRTYPGGVSKWQWKRMQARKAKQLLKARLCRERQIYEMRKRAELRAAVSELERPWEAVERAPALLSVRADEQVKVLADRFQKPGGFDLWSEKDGPQLFETPDELPSARFFPKGVVHSVRPYRRIGADELLEDDGDGGDGDEGYSSSDLSFDGELSKKGSEARILSEGVDDGECSSPTMSYGGNNGVSVNGKLRKNENGRRFLSEGAEDGSDDGDFSSSPLSYGRNGRDYDGRIRNNRNGRRLVSKGVGDGSDNGECSSPSSFGRNGGNYDGRMKRNANGRRSLSKGFHDGSDDGECSSYPSSSERNGGNVDSRMRKNGNGRRFMSKNVNGSNGLYSRRVGSGRKQGGSDSGATRSAGRYSRGTSSYASTKVRDAGSEVYDMDLQQDGSYEFH